MTYVVVPTVVVISGVVVTTTEVRLVTVVTVLTDTELENSEDCELDTLVSIELTLD